MAITHPLVLVRVIDEFPHSCDESLGLPGVRDGFNDLLGTYRAPACDQSGTNR